MLAQFEAIRAKGVDSESMSLGQLVGSSAAVSQCCLDFGLDHLDSILCPLGATLRLSWAQDGGLGTG